MMEKLLGKLLNANVIKIDYGPYGAMTVLAQKPNQGHGHWTEYRGEIATESHFAFPLDVVDE